MRLQRFLFTWEDGMMLLRFQIWLLSLLDRYFGLEKLALRAGLSREEARRVAKYQQ